MGGSWDMPNIDCEPDKSKWLAKGKLGEMPHMNDLWRLIWPFHKGATQQLRDCPSESARVTIHTYGTLFSSLNKYFICFTTFHVYGNSFLQNWGPGPSSVTTRILVARIWCSHHQDSASIWIREPPEVTLSPIPPPADGLTPFLATLVMAAEPVDRDSWVSTLCGARSRGWGSHSEQRHLPGLHSLWVSLWWRWETNKD